jgi:hypothetical protein
MSRLHRTQLDALVADILGAAMRADLLTVEHYPCEYGDARRARRA